MEKKQKTQNIKQRSSLYAIGAFFPKVIEYLLLPFWTRWLSAAEFGLVGLVVAICKFFSGILTLGVPAVLSKEIYNKKYTKQDISRMISSNLVFIVIFAIVTLGMIYCFQQQVWSSWFIGKDIDLSVYGFTIACMILGKVIMLCGVSLARVQRLAFQSVLCDALGLMIGLVVGLYMVGALDMGAKGRLIGMSVGFCLSAVFYLFYVHKKQLTYRVSFSDIKHITGRGMPLVLHTIAGSVITLSDRFYVKAYCGLSETGLYTLATTLALTVSVIGSALSQAWQPEIYEKLENKDEKKSIDFISGWLMTVGSLSICLILGSGECLTIIASEDFFEAYKILPILIIAMVWQTLYFYVANLLKYRLKTKTLSSIAIVVAMVNILLNTYLVPIYGGVGAAIATSIAMFIMCGLVYYYSKEDVKIFVNLNKLWLYMLFILVSLIVAYTVEIWSIYGIVIKLTIVALFLYVAGWYRYLKNIYVKRF